MHENKFMFDHEVQIETVLDFFRVAPPYSANHCCFLWDKLVILPLYQSPISPPPTVSGGQGYSYYNSSIFHYIYKMPLESHDIPIIFLFYIPIILIIYIYTLYTLYIIICIYIYIYTFIIRSWGTMYHIP